MKIDPTETEMYREKKNTHSQLNILIKENFKESRDE